MKLSEITNLDTITLIENSTQLFRLKKYNSKEYVEKFIGLGLSRASFYGIKDKDGNVLALDKRKFVFGSNDDITLVIEGAVVLDKAPVNFGLGNINYTGYGILEANNSVIYNGRSSSLGHNHNDLYYTRPETDSLLDSVDTAFVPVYVNENLYVESGEDYKLVEQFSFYSEGKSLNSMKLLYTTLEESYDSYVKVIASTGETLLAETRIPTFEFDPGLNLFTRRYIAEREVQEVEYVLTTPSADCRVSILSKPEVDITFKNIIIR